MIKNETFKAVGIIGNPLRQSLSPYLHNYWIKKYGLASYYLPLPIDNINYLKGAIKKLNFLKKSYQMLSTRYVSCVVLLK